MNMPSIVKAVLGLVLFAIWGPYLLYVWAVPDAVPEWVMRPGMRKVMMLSRDFEPTFFTLMFGVTFTGLAVYGAIATATGNAYFQKQERASARPAKAARAAHRIR
ncbi:MAG: hypothetical protein AAGH57_03845 [Pseudomonadota bacterium]